MRLSASLTNGKSVDIDKSAVQRIKSSQTIGTRLIQEKTYGKAIALLSHTVQTIKVQEFPNEHWVAKGLLGYAHEKASDTDTAIGVFETAVKDGSNDQRTYTRYLMYLEKQKQYEKALSVIEQGLRVQHGAAWQIRSGTVVWQTELPKAANGILVTSESIVTYVKKGRVGDGAAILRFSDFADNEVISQRLPDAPSEIVASGRLVYAGCRDGKLYAFSGRGKPLWSFCVPGSEEQQDLAYMRPSPYYVRAISNLVVFSSFSSIFAINDRGKLHWQWSVPERKLTRRSGGITVAVSSGPIPVCGFAISADGSCVIVTADDVIYELVKWSIQ